MLNMKPLKTTLGWFFCTPVLLVSGYSQIALAQLVPPILNDIETGNRLEFLQVDWDPGDLEVVSCQLETHGSVLTGEPDVWLTQVGDVILDSYEVTFSADGS